MKPRAIVIFCGLLMSSSAFSVDIMLPSLPSIVDDLAAPYGLVQWTITFYMAMAGLAQLLWGPLSDRVGRKPALAGGLAIYLAGCLISALAPSIGWLLAGRLLQGFGGAAAIVLARAVLRDMFSGQELARNLAFATAIFAIGPILAPLAGAAIAVPLGWRAIFGGLALFAAGLLLVLLRMPETIRQRVPEAVQPRVIGRRFVRIWAHPQSRYFLLVSVVIMSTMLLILSSIPRIYDVQFDIRGATFALFFALHGFGIIIGQTVNRRLITRVGVVRAMLVGNVVLIASAALILALSLAGLIDIAVMTALLVLYGTSYLVVYANATAMVLDPHGDIAGFAAAVFGFTSQIGASLIVSVLVLVTGPSPVGFGLALLGICLFCATMIVSWLVTQRGRAATAETTR